MPGTNFRMQRDQSLPQVSPERAGPRLGIIGGGQLAKMTAQAAQQLGCEVVILEKNDHSPAMRLVAEHLVGDWNSPEALLELAGRVDVLTLENEFVDATALAAVEAAGHTLMPTSHSLSLTQDKFIQKTTLAEAGLPVPRFLAVETPEELRAAGDEFGWPVVLKTRRNGYDGKGNYTVRSPEDIAAGWQALGAGKVTLFVEAFCHFEKELAVIITRALDGQSAVYPVVESIQKDHICHVVKAPAPIAQEIAARAGEIARQAIAAVGGLGSFGVEMFLTPAGEICINELAPRVHNTGHYTIEACECSQFENHVRAVLGWPLGSTRMVAPAAVMLNLIGDRGGTGRPQGLEHALAIPGAHVHLYGKALAGKGRKLGHLTVLGNDLAEVLGRAERAAAAITFGSEA